MYKKDFHWNKMRFMKQSLCIHTYNVNVFVFTVMLADRPKINLQIFEIAAASYTCSITKCNEKKNEIVERIKWEIKQFSLVVRIIFELYFFYFPFTIHIVFSFLSFNFIYIWTVSFKFYFPFCFFFVQGKEQIQMVLKIFTSP